MITITISGGQKDRVVKCRGFLMATVDSEICEDGQTRFVQQNVNSDSSFYDFGRNAKALRDSISKTLKIDKDEEIADGMRASLSLGTRDTIITELDRGDDE